MSEQNNEDNTPLLSSTQARILACLMEKQLTTPDVYPLTLNSLVTACNQKTNRLPVMCLDPGDVQRNLNELKEQGFIHIDYGSRADRYDQRFSRKLYFDTAEQSIFTLLLLRGPQTLNELYSRSQRMHEFESLSELEHLIEKCIAKVQSWLIKIPCQPGQREDRYMHLFCGKPDLNQYSSKSSQQISTADEDLLLRVQTLEKQVASILVQLEKE